MRLSSLLHKELIQFFRDPVVLFLIFWLYTIEVVICSYALGMEMRDLPLAVVDTDESPASRRLIDDFIAGGNFRLVAHLHDVAAAEPYLERGEAQAVLVIPVDFERELYRGGQALQFLVDGSNANTAAVARGYALQTVEAFRMHRGTLDERQLATVAAQLRTWYNPDQTNVGFTVLAMIALAGLMIGVVHPAASIVREKEVGTIEQLMVTPIRRGELFIAKTVPTLLIGLLALFPSLALVGWFGVPVRGSLPLFFALTALFLLSAIGLGVLVAAVSRTLQQALLLAFFGLFPLMFLSGTMVPVDSMPNLLQKLSLASPLRHYLDITLGIFLKGAGMEILWPHALALVAIGMPLYLAAWLIFRRWL
ncbi:ABC transporter permease [Billgrantia diversa]|uniref:ABC transporter permease n=1 Tax=Halomonas sp. MCCC 1A13316 TaxID=2733487 RepID=UPI0018A64093|nr:ABC transporter permease [Halomonas sp. MCCC 1A13316]QOR38188.1 ABC transporter permease [Halomonas sp. MCCC 1A13316]